MKRSPKRPQIDPRTKHQYYSNYADTVSIILTEAMKSLQNQFHSQAQAIFDQTLACIHGINSKGESMTGRNNSQKFELDLRYKVGRTLDAPAL